MNPQDSNKKLQQKQDVKNAISDYQGIEKNDDSLNTSVSEFTNSSTVRSEGLHNLGSGFHSNKRFLSNVF